MSKIMNMTIEKSIIIKDDVSQIWRSILDYTKFGKWFGIKLNGPFMIRRFSKGEMLISDQKIVIDFFVETIKFEEEFAYSWHPNVIDPRYNYSEEKCTLVTFMLKKLSSSNTLITVTETDFEHLPAERCNEAYKANKEGWEIQLDNLKKYIEEDNKHYNHKKIS